MKYAVLGSGGVGQSIAKGLLNLGYEVMIATRNTSKPELLDLHSTQLDRLKMLQNGVILPFFAPNGMVLKMLFTLLILKT
jgi:saccharopine dehydrogenase-like NADP-dependent oxidoreductase